MRHHANPRFWRCHRELPQEIRQLADRNYKLLKADPGHRSLQLKHVGRFWSVRVGLRYRALAVEAGSDVPPGASAALSPPVGLFPVAASARVIRRRAACIRDHDLLVIE